MKAWGRRGEGERRKEERGRERRKEGGGRGSREKGGEEEEEMSELPD